MHTCARRLPITYLYLREPENLRLESRTHVVESLEQLLGSIESHRRECEDFHVVLDRRVGWNAHVFHREQAARPIHLNVALLVGICANDCDFAIFDDTLQERLDEALLPAFFGVDGMFWCDNQELQVDERTDALLGFFWRHMLERRLVGLIVEDETADDFAFIGLCDANTTSVLCEMLGHQFGRVDSLGCEEVQESVCVGVVAKLDTSDVEIFGRFGNFGGGFGGGFGLRLRLRLRSEARLTAHIMRDGVDNLVLLFGLRREGRKGRHRRTGTV